MAAIRLPHAIRRLAWLWIVLAGAGAIPSLDGADPASAPTFSSLGETPLPAVAAFARSHGIPIAGIESAPDGEGPRSGDGVTLLVSLVETGHRRQWLALVETDNLTAGERDSRPPIGDVVRFTTTGNELRYRVTANAALLIRFIGPFSGDSAGTAAPPGERNERVRVSPEFLGFGLDHTCRIWVRLQENLKQGRAAGRIGNDLFLPLQSSTTRFPASTVQKTRQAAAEIDFTPDDERPFYGAELALEAFVRVVEATPEANRILSEVVERPSWWSVVAHLGIEGAIATAPQEIHLLDPRPAGFPGAVYRLPFTLSLNGQPALEGALAVTAPRPPLLACAGVIGVEAAAPRNPGKKLLIRVIAARRGAGAPIHAPVETAP